MHGNYILQNVRITANDVCDKLKRLLEDKACGPDGIHPKLPKECAEIIAIHLYLIFSKSLESGVVPADWKLANVYPIHKKGSRAMANNYRPVSLTCLASTIIESIIRDAMVQHLSQRAMTVLRSVKRAFVRFDIETFSIIYTTYIRPHLEYCIQAWAPYYA